MRFASSRLRALALTLACTSPLSACGDDDGGETGAATTTSDPSPTSSTTDADSTSTTATTLDASTGSTTADTTADDTTDDTTDLPSDPAYPRPDGGTCPAGTAPVNLPGAQVCAPFCTGADDPCPVAASGTAPPECTPFAGQGGSGDPCDDRTPCRNGEACGNDGTCGEVAFWACQLQCGAGEACPDGMMCSGTATCGYP